ncbi:hypothetical protein T11_10246 [Trichinella zimbabwensis]|uniref:Uncharacterized protein n=1 Tax=Trichinella zimbabwensis TaxID=268475 RepID=A0A0V1GL76_9BILA|nr:hypothetical protein T11_10246 [Trichinella zimbabwensis]
MVNDYLCPYKGQDQKEDIRRTEEDQEEDQGEHREKISK